MAAHEMHSTKDWKQFLEDNDNPTIYVRMTDSFFSGWGEAEGKTNVLILPASDMTMAYALIDWIRRNRDEMKRIDYGYTSRMPHSVYDRSKLVQYGTYEDYSVWYERAGIKTPAVRS